MILSPKFRNGDKIEFASFDNIVVTKQDRSVLSPIIRVSCKLNGEDAMFPINRFGRIMDDHRHYNNDYERLHALAGTTRIYKKRHRITHIQERWIEAYTAYPW